MLSRLSSAVSGAGCKVLPSVPVRLVRSGTVKGNGITTVVHAAKAEGAMKEPPKRAPTAFNLYTKDKFGLIKQEIERNGTKATLAQVNVRLREMWGSLPDTLKAPYEKKADEEKEKLVEAK
jgi:hypothetical protein